MNAISRRERPRNRARPPCSRGALVTMGTHTRHVTELNAPTRQARFSMETLTNVVLLGLLGATMAVALWAWHEVRDIATGWQDAHAVRRRRTPSCSGASSRA